MCPKSSGLFYVCFSFVYLDYIVFIQALKKMSKLIKIIVIAEIFAEAFYVGEKFPFSSFSERCFLQLRAKAG